MGTSWDSQAELAGEGDPAEQKGGLQEDEERGHRDNLQQQHQLHFLEGFSASVHRF